MEKYARTKPWRDGPALKLLLQVPIAHVEIETGLGQC